MGRTPGQLGSGPVYLEVHMEQKQRPRQQGWRLIQTAYVRDGELIYTGEAMSLACLLHTKGRGRNSTDMVDVQKIMQDINLESESN